MTPAVLPGLRLVVLDTRLNTLLSQVVAEAVVGWAVEVALAGILAAQRELPQGRNLWQLLVLAGQGQTQTLLLGQTEHPLACQG